MRGDFVLPTFLATALALMIVYAANDNVSNGAAIASSPLACERSSSLVGISELREASGLAMSRRTPHLLWSHNDSAEPIAYGLGADGKVHGRVRIEGASVTDWEAITTASCDGGNCLFIGDIGDNDRARADITIYRANEPGPDDRVTPATAIKAVYPEGPQDAEAIFVTGGALYLVTKGEGAPIRLYRLASLDSNARHTLQLVTTLTDGPSDKAARITDAAVSPNERWVALRSNDLVLFYETKALLSGRPTPPLSFDLRPLREPQGEGIAWSDDTTLFLAGEGQGAGTFARISCNLPA